MYLTSLYEAGASYSRLNLARSALSTCLDKIDNHNVGTHPLVVRLMKGVYRLRPPSAKYSYIWDVNLVFNIIKSWGPNSCSSLESLTMKLCGLLALSTGQRVQTLASIFVENILMKEPVEIKITKILKTSRVGSKQPLLVLPSFTDESLCVVKCLQQYLLVTREFRVTGQLFISYKQPHKPVTTQTISRWLCNLLKLCKIDTNVFKSHSFRHSSVSKAAKIGVSTDMIFAAAHWSAGSKMFAKFYNRPIVSRCDFAHSLVSNVN